MKTETEGFNTSDIRQLAGEVQACGSSSMGTSKQLDRIALMLVMVYEKLEQVDSSPRERKMEKALKRIHKWFGEFPPTGRTWEDGSEMSHSACMGSNGERDYMRDVAAQALVVFEDDTPDASTTQPPQPEVSGVNADWLKAAGFDVKGIHSSRRCAEGELRVISVNKEFDAAEFWQDADEDGEYDESSVVLAHRTEGLLRETVSALCRGLGTDA